MIKRIVKSGRKLKVKRRPKFSEWELLYNRLHDDEDFGVYEQVAKQHSSDPFEDLFDMIEFVLARFDSRVETLQINFPEHVSWRVCLTWTDHKAKPSHGYLYPKLYTVKTAHSLLRAATLAYLELCKQAGRWL